MRFLGKHIVLMAQTGKFVVQKSNMGKSCKKRMYKMRLQDLFEKWNLTGLKVKTPVMKMVTP